MSPDTPFSIWDHLSQTWWLYVLVMVFFALTLLLTFSLFAGKQATAKKDTIVDPVKTAPEPAPEPADAPKVDAAKPAAPAPEAKVEPKPAPAKAGSGFFHTPLWRLVRRLAILTAFAGAGWWTWSNWDYLVDTFNQVRVERAAGGAEAPFSPATPDAPEASPAEDDGVASPIATPALDAVTHRVQTLYQDYVADTPVGDTLAFAANLSNDLGQTLELPEHSITYVLGGILALALLYVLYRVIRAVWRAFLGQTWLTAVLVLVGAVFLMWYAYTTQRDARFVEHPELVRENGEEVHVSPRVGVQVVYVEWNEKLVMHLGTDICMQVSISDEWLEANNIDTPFPDMNYEDTTTLAFTYVATPALQGELRMQGIPQQFTITGTRC